MYQNPTIKTVTAWRASQVAVTLPANTLRFAISAQKATAVVKLAFINNVVSNASASNIFYVPKGIILDQSNLTLKSQVLYVAVTGLATSPVSILYWR